jgi:hypothetical protein
MRDKSIVKERAKLPRKIVLTSCFSPVFWRWFTSSRRVFIVGTVAAAVAGISQCLVASGALESLQLDYHWFIPLDGSIVAFFDRIALMPTLVLAGQNCPPGATFSPSLCPPFHLLLSYATTFCFGSALISEMLQREFI